MRGLIIELGEKNPGFYSLVGLFQARGLVRFYRFTPPLDGPEYQGWMSRVVIPLYNGSKLLKRRFNFTALQLPFCSASLTTLAVPANCRSPAPLLYPCVMHLYSIGLQLSGLSKSPHSDLGTNDRIIRKCRIWKFNN